MDNIADEQTINALSLEKSPVRKGLIPSFWRLMRLVDRLDEVEAGPEHDGDIGRCISLHRQTAALLRAVGSKRRDDGGTGRLYRATKVRDVRLALLGSRQEVKKGAVVPDVHRLDVPVAGHI